MYRNKNPKKGITTRRDLHFGFGVECWILQIAFKVKYTNSCYNIFTKYNNFVIFWQQEKDKDLIYSYYFLNSARNCWDKILSQRKLKPTAFMYLKFHFQLLKIINFQRVFLCTLPRGFHTVIVVNWQYPGDAITIIYSPACLIHIYKSFMQYFFLLHFI